MINNGKPNGSRVDIQVLRGFAVLIVLLYHAKIDFIKFGYLGVDIFFVISGFLITGLLKREIEAGTFSFPKFYFRRAKRLLPALYVVILATAILAPLFLGSRELSDLKMQVLGAVTFTENIVLWRQSGYFEGAAELKPLLHIWSLAIEEQYYLVIPLVMFVLPRRFLFSAFLLCALLSLALCFYIADLNQSAAFYLLPTRGWELATGSVGALISIGPRTVSFLRKMFWPSIIIVILAPFVSVASYHPGPDAVLVCLATLIIILRNHRTLNSGLIQNSMARVGDISYSLYLVHWPIFAFLNNVWVGEGGVDAPISWRLWLILLSFVLAYALHRYIEEPFRKIDIKATKKVIFGALATTASLLLTTTGLSYAVESDKDYEHIRRANKGLHEKCEFTSDFKPIAACKTSDSPSILVWGDSFAMHLVPGIVGSGADGVIQATRSLCGPFIGLAPLAPQRGYNENWAKGCISFNDSVFEYLKGAESVKFVVLSSPFGQYLSNDAYNLKRGNSGSGLETISGGPRVALEGIKFTIDKLHSIGKKVVIVGPPPSGGFDMGLCAERIESGLVTAGAFKGCQFDIEMHHKKSSDTIEFLKEIPKISNVNVLNFENYLCKDGYCDTYINGVFIYRDSGHLSHEGSTFLGKEMSLASTLKEMAR